MLLNRSHRTGIEDLEAPDGNLKAAAKEGEGRLVQQARAGDAEAFEELFRRFAPRLFGVARRLTRNKEEAEDVVQESFLKAFRNLSRFRGDSLMSTWLTRIVVNEAFMKLRRRRFERVSIDEPVEMKGGAAPREIGSGERSPEELCASRELGAAMAREIRRLEPGLRIVFELRDIEQLSTEETAQVLGLSLTAVKSRLCRARSRLRESLRPHLGRAAAHRVGAFLEAKAWGC